MVNKNASINEKSVKSMDLATLYKKCNLKSSANFDKRHTWKVGTSFYSVYAKDGGRANSENKYDLPPPIDDALYFNTMVVIKHTGPQATNDTVVDLTKEEWGTTYETLFGGFEDLDHSEEMSEEEQLLALLQEAGMGPDGLASMAFGGPVQYKANGFGITNLLYSDNCP